MNSKYLKFLNLSSLDEETRRKEFILKLILLGAIAIAIFAFLQVVYTHYFGSKSENVISPVVPFFIALTLTVLYFLASSKYFIFSALALIFLFFLPTAFSAYSWGIELPQALLCFVMLIVVSGILVSPAFGWVMTAISSATVMVLGYSQSHGITSPDLSWKLAPLNIGDAIAISFSLGIIMIVSWLYNQEIKKSLQRAIKSEKELKKERDLLEVKVEERTRELRKAQIEKMAQISHFAEFGRLASGIFHDLVNPLTAISLNLEQISTKDVEDIDGAKTYLKKALDATKRMEEFVLAVKKQIQKQETNEMFSIVDEINQVIRILSYKIRKSNVKVVFNKPDCKVELIGNPLKFHQVVSNLVSNAIDAYEDYKSKKPEIIISINHNNKETSISIQDFGKGIPTEIKNKVFDPFFTTKDLSRGTGIGLSIVKEIVKEDFKGKIELISKEKEGTCFTLTLPNNS